MLMDVSVDNEVIVNAVGTVEVAVGNAADAVVADDHALDITVTKKEYKIVGDEVYIAKLYEDAPQWMKDLVQLVVDNTMVSESTALLNSLVSQLNQFAVSYVPLNAYTQSIIDLSNADTAMHDTLETLNSNFNDGLNTANSQIIDLQSTKASKDEVATKVIETLTAQLATPTSELGATIGNLQQAIVTGDTANADSIQTLMSTLEGEVDARATAVEDLYTAVGAVDSGVKAVASKVTALSTELNNGTNTWAAADSALENTLNTTISNGDASTVAKFGYNSSVTVNGITSNSGFGLVNSASTVNGKPTSGSEFWIDASKFKFTNSANSGATSPFTIDASGATPQITFNGKVSFSNVTNVPQLGSTPQEVVNAVNAGNTTTINGGKITTGTITAGLIVVDNIAVANTYLVAGNITTIGTFGSSLTTGNTGHIGGFTVSNPSGAQMKVAVVGTGRTGVLGAATTGVSQAFGMFTGNDKVFDYGWSSLAEDAKSCTFTYIIPSGSSVTFSLYGAHTTWSGQHTINMQFSILGIRN